MSPIKSGVVSPVESSDNFFEKVLEFHESARFSITIFLVKIYPPSIIIHSSLSEPKENSEERKLLMPIKFLRRGGRVQINKSPTQG